MFKDIVEFLGFSSSSKRDTSISGNCNLILTMDIEHLQYRLKKVEESLRAIKNNKSAEGSSFSENYRRSK